MLNKILSVFIFILFFQVGFAQENLKSKISIFIPIHLDDAFEGNTFKIWDNKIPKNMLMGLEYYNGIMFAIDSLKQSKKYSNVEITIHDYKSNNNSIDEIIKKDSETLASNDLFIAVFTNKNEIKPLAGFALANKIPLISATFPNDAGITNNPYFFLLNSTIQTHCKAIYNFLLSKQKDNNIIFLTKSGGFEDNISTYFKSLDSNKLLSLKPHLLTDTFYSNQLIKYLDSTKNNIIVCATISEVFALRIAGVLANNKKFKATIIGMPTWDAIKSFNNKDYRDIEFVYTTPFYFEDNAIINRLQFKYKQKFDGRASDQFFKGYETALRFIPLISLYKENAVQLFTDDMFKCFNSLDIQPVYSKKNATEINYYENKKIYFVKKINGSTNLY